MAVKPIAAVVGCVLAVVACETATAPDRSDNYYSRLAQSGLLFRWPANRLPVRFWVDPAAGPVSQYVLDGIGVWEAQFLYGEFRATLVADGATADVRVRVDGQTPPAVPLTDDDPVSACDGDTGFDTTAVQITAPFEITLRWNFLRQDTDVANCLARVTLHEIGHALGLFVHSDSPDDLMNTQARVRQPSSRDRATLEMLYHTAPTLGPPERPQQ